MTQEEIYDKEVAPKLAELAKFCTEHGMSFFAAVEYEQHGHIGETRMLVPGYHSIMLSMSNSLHRFTDD